MKMSALIRGNLHTEVEGMTPREFAEAYAQSVWLEQFRLRNMAELLSAMFGAKKK